MENETEQAKKPSKKIVFIIMAVVVIILAIFLSVKILSKGKNNQTEKPSGKEMKEIPETTESQAVPEKDGEELTPEEVIARLNEEEGIGVEQGPVEAEIISPEEESFMPSQARLYRARIEGLEKGSKCTCNWKFYLNEYDEEVLYQQMDDRPCTGGDLEEGLVCGFTTTFIKSRGDLRVHVDVEVEKQGEIVQTAEAEKMYKVQ